MDGRGPFPKYVQKTDQERIQNCYGIYSENYADLEFEGTLKVDGTSCTVLMNMDNEIEVCSRNLSLKESEGNKYWEASLKNGVIEFVNWCGQSGRQIAVQGEIMGPNIQKNREQFKDHFFYIFDIFDISTQSYLSSEERLRLISTFEVMSKIKLRHVPILYTNAKILSYPLPKILELADILSIINLVGEGIVWKCISNPQISFKVINNKFLLKEGD